MWSNTRRIQNTYCHISHIYCLMDIRYTADTGDSFQPVVPSQIHIHQLREIYNIYQLLKLRGVLQFFIYFFQYLNKQFKNIIVTNQEILGDCIHSLDIHLVSFCNRTDNGFHILFLDSHLHTIEMYYHEYKAKMSFLYWKLT